MTHLLPRSAPDQQGLPAAAIARFVRALDDIPHIHTLTVVRHGHVVAEFARAPYARENPHALYSVSKSFTALAVGLAIEEGRFGLEDRVVDLLADIAPQHQSPRLEALRVRHLLTMTTGHDAEPWPEDEHWARGVLVAELAHEPGTHWMYNTPATHLLSQIVQTTTGERLLDYLTPRLFDPLGFDAPTWLHSQAGVDAGGFGLSLRAEELAAFGQLLLQRGRWHDRQLVPAEWIDQATSRQVANGVPSSSDWDQGYGYQFWQCRHGAYRADGAFGQYVVVLPDHDAVVTMTGGLRDMARPLDALWETLLPAFDTVEDAADIPAPRAIPPSGGERRDLQKTFEYDGPVRRLSLSEDVLDLDGLALRFSPTEWVTGSAMPLLERDEVYGDLVAVSGGWHGDRFVALVRALEDAVTFRLVLTATGRLTITRDVGFTGSRVWQGDPVAPQSTSVPAAIDHHSVVSP